MKLKKIVENNFSKNNIFFWTKIYYVQCFIFIVLLFLCGYIYFFKESENQIIEKIQLTQSIQPIQNNKNLPENSDLNSFANTLQLMEIATNYNQNHKVVNTVKTEKSINSAKIIKIIEPENNINITNISNVENIENSDNIDESEEIQIAPTIKKKPLFKVN